MRITNHKIKILLPILFLILSFGYSSGQCNKKVVKITFYKTPLFQTSYIGRSIDDVIDIVDRKQNDSTIAKMTVSNITILEKIDSLLKADKWFKSIICDQSDCQKKKHSMDIRHVFIIEFSDGSNIRIGISSAENLMMVNKNVYKRRQSVIIDLYRCVSNPSPR
jgi:hypothetical protein